MLHSRRKAEIEVLSSMDVGQVLSTKSMQDEAAEYPRNGLLDYVVGIINNGVDDATRKYATQS